MHKLFCSYAQCQGSAGKIFIIGTHRNFDIPGSRLSFLANFDHRVLESRYQLLTFK